VTQQQFNELYDLTLEISRLISGFMKYLQQSELRGPKSKLHPRQSNLEL